MIPSNFNKMGTNGYKLIGIRAIGNSYIDTGIIPRFGYESNISILSFDGSGEETQIISGIQYDVNRVCQLFLEQSKTRYVLRYSNTTSDALNPIPFSSLTYPLTITMTEGAYTVNNTTYNYSSDPSVLAPTLPIYLFFGNGSNSTAYYKGVISDWTYSDDVNSIALKPEIQHDNTVKLVDKLTGYIPQHIGEFEPVFDKKSGDGDCLINGQFSKVAPNGIVTGGSCLINGDSYFRDRKDVISIEGSFANLTSANHMFYGTNVTSIPVDAFPAVRSLISTFFNVPLTEFKCEVPDLSSATYCFYLCKFTTFESDFSKVDNLSFTFYRCPNLVNVNFINGLPALSKASPNAFSDCVKLSSDSIDNIINALPVTTTPLEIGFANVPMTQSQYNAFIAKGWTPTGAIIS